MQLKHFLEVCDIVGESVAPYSGTKKYVATADVDEGEIVSATDVDYQTRPSRADVQVQPGTLLFAKMKGTVKVLRITDENKTFIYSTGFYAIKPKNGVDIDYLENYLKTSFFNDQKDRLSVGATMKGLNNKGLRNIKIPDYQVDEQRRISSQMTLIDKAICSLNKEADYYNELINSRFLELFGNPLSNPYSWPVKRLGQEGDFQNGMNFGANESGQKIRCLSVSDFKNRIEIDDCENLPQISLNLMPNSTKLLQDGDIVFVRSNGNKRLVGRSLLVFPKGIPLTFSGFCIRYRRNSKSFGTSYLIHALRTQSVREALMGRGANIQNLNQKTLNSISIPVPPMELQDTYNVFVQQTNQAIKTIEREIRGYQEMLDSKRQQYFGVF